MHFHWLFFIAMPPRVIVGFRPRAILTLTREYLAKECFYQFGIVTERKCTLYYFWRTHIKKYHYTTRKSQGIIWKINLLKALCCSLVEYNLNRIWKLWFFIMEKSRSNFIIEQFLKWNRRISILRRIFGFQVFIIIEIRFQ